MNKLKFLGATLITSSLLTGTMLMGADKKMSDAEIRNVVSKTEILKNPTLQVVKGIDRGDFYQFKVKTDTGRGYQEMDSFVLKKSGETFFGSGYAKSGEKMIMGVDKSVIEKGITYSYGKGKKDLYIFTNPECPHCIDFENALKPVMGTFESEFRVHVVILNEQSKKSAFILAGTSDEDKRNRMEAVMTGDSYNGMKNLSKRDWRKVDLVKDFKMTKPVQDKVMVQMQNSFVFARDIGVNSTPAVFTSDYQQIRWDMLVLTMENLQKAKAAKK